MRRISPLGCRPPLFDGLFKIALAEAEFRAGDIGGALMILDEALVTSERTGQRTFEAELHRARDELPSILATLSMRTTATSWATGLISPHGWKGSRSLEQSACRSMPRGGVRRGDRFGVLP